MIKNEIKLHLIEQNRQVHYVLLLPETGCPGRISTPEIFLQDYSDHPQLYTILTKIVSKKDFEIKTGIDLENSSIYVDEKNQFNLEGPNNIYPSLFIFENGTIVEVQYQKPGNDFFGYLREDLAKPKS